MLTPMLSAPLSYPHNKVTLVPLIPGAEYLLWAEKEIRFASLRPLGRTLADQLLVGSASNPWPQAEAAAELERGLVRLADTVPFEERFIFHVQAAILRASFRLRADRSQPFPHDRDCPQTDTAA